MSELIISHQDVLNVLKHKVPKPLAWTSLSLQDIRLMTARDFLECKKSEEVKILTDGGNPVLWNYPLVKSAVLKSIDKGVKVKCIIGPAAYSENGYNFLLEQALPPNESIEMYVSQRNEMANYRKYGERKIWLEKYHNPLDKRSSRQGKYYLNQPGSLSIIGFLRYSKDFETCIKVYDLKRITSIDNLLVLEKDDLRKLAKHAKENEDIFCQYERRNMERILAN